MGLKVGEVRLEKHNLRWHRMFAQELDELWEYFGDTAIRISHIGSTAIDGLEAKPIVDIAVAVNDLEDFDQVAHRFTSNPEYSIKKDADKDEILIRKGGKLKRQFYIHVMDIDSKRYKDVIFFRDTLLRDKRIRDDYRDLKHVLANKYQFNRKKYSSSKGAFIDSAIEMQWAKSALMPISIVAAVSLCMFVISLYYRLTVPLSARINGVYIVNICQTGLFFSGVLFAFSALTSSVLLRRYLIAKEGYGKIMQKAKREIEKESHKNRKSA